MPALRALLFLLLAPFSLAAPKGAAIYTEHCASCHGDSGEGVAKEYDEALVGKKSIQSLAKYIHRRTTRMPSLMKTPFSLPSISTALFTRLRLRQN